MAPLRVPDYVQQELGLLYIKPMRGGAQGGDINVGKGYHTDQGSIFVKEVRGENKCRVMFDGELASLRAISATETVRCPRPLAVVQPSDETSAVLVTEYLSFTSLRAQAAKLGELLARMHLHNSNMLEKADAEASRVGGPKAEEGRPVREFGFDVPTCCGRIEQNNTWLTDWTEFYARHRLEAQVRMILRDSGDRKLTELWPRLQRRLPGILGTTSVRPALLHGDLWCGNAGETDTEPVVFDPASFYGHSEFELGIVAMFGGFPAEFYRSYHRLIPKQPGFEERSQLYQLFHQLNHWNHFGSSYRSGTIQLFQSLVRPA